ncbi:phage shock protein PspA [Puniceicoccaceae bacterium K14]|nr:phage shock protein PspA [Puniceicoccaceae bacterium K14]
MGIFTRFKDIVGSNINAMLDKAEDPEKLIKLMIQEMEDTLVEIKASCAGVMANKASTSRTLKRAQDRVVEWEEKAKLAISKARDDLAKEALLEKRRYMEEMEKFQKENDSLEEVITKYKADMAELESKLNNAREKHKTLVHRHAQAEKSHKAQTTIRKANTSDAFVRFEAFENRIERMEASAGLVNVKPKATLDEEFAKLEQDDALEDELAALKRSIEDKSTNG